MRSPYLDEMLCCFCLGAFAVFDVDTLSWAPDWPFAFEEHGTYGRPTPHQYRPPYVASSRRGQTGSSARRDVRHAVDDLLQEPGREDRRELHMPDQAPNEARCCIAACSCRCLVPERPEGRGGLRLGR